VLGPHPRDAATPHNHGATPRRFTRVDETQWTSAEPGSRPHGPVGVRTRGYWWDLPREAHVDAGKPAKTVRKAVKATVDSVTAGVVTGSDPATGLDELHTALGAHRVWERFGTVVG
jgi:hypothetical protein